MIQQKRIKFEITDTKYIIKWTQPPRGENHGADKTSAVITYYTEQIGNRNSR